MSRVRQRRYGQTGISLSEVCFGSMRINEIPEGDDAGLLALLHDLGIDTHHSSHEYDSHLRYLGALHACRSSGRRTKHVVKLAEPDFRECGFDGLRFELAVDRELRTLGTDVLHNVQWLVRSQPINDIDRLAMLEQDGEQISATFERLVAAGKVLSFSSFPYSTAFADRVRQLPQIAGLTTYLNLYETEYAVHTDCAFIAIRPLAAGRLKGDSWDEMDALVPLNASFSSLRHAALEFPLINPAVTSQIVSIKTPGQAQDVAEIASRVNPSRERFDAWVRQIQSHTKAKTAEAA